MFRSALILAAGLALVAVPAAAQTWGGTYDGGYRHRDGGNAVPSNFDWRSQLDRPGDFRCDQFWDASRDDCGARWRDQRHRVSPQARGEYRALAGYGRGHGHGHGHGYGGHRRGYGSAYGHGQGSTTFHGAYGRPDHVYLGGGTGHGGYGGGYGGGYSSSYGSGHGGGYGSGYNSGYSGGHGGGRADWCRATYRSYNPATGYYRGYSGHLIYCG